MTPRHLSVIRHRGSDGLATYEFAGNVWSTICRSRFLREERSDTTEARVWLWLCTLTTALRVSAPDNGLPPLVSLSATTARGRRGCLFI